MELAPAQTATSSASMTMPAFAGGTHAYTHTVDSALVSLAALGVSPNRIHLLRAGRDGSTPGTVVRQRPKSGEVLHASTMVELEISGLGFTHALPVGMWDSGGEAAAGTREILQPFDDPLEKLKHWYHEGAPLFRISPDDLPACARWLGLFGVDAREWPRTLWFRLASLMARMAQFSCSQDGWAFVINALLGLRIAEFRYRPSETLLPPEMLSSLGGRCSQLGIDMLLGDRMEELAVLTIEFSPVSLATYERFTDSPEGIALLGRTLALIMPCSTQYELAWQVLDKSRAPQLGVAERNARLGINTHLGGVLGGDLGEMLSVPMSEDVSVETSENFAMEALTARLTGSDA